MVLNLDILVFCWLLKNWVVWQNSKANLICLRNIAVLSPSWVALTLIVSEIQVIMCPPYNLLPQISSLFFNRSLWNFQLLRTRLPSCVPSLKAFVVKIYVVRNGDCRTTPPQRKKQYCPPLTDFGSCCCLPLILWLISKVAHIIVSVTTCIS